MENFENCGVVNYDWGKENDYLDGLKKGADCGGGYCMNCGFLPYCDHVPALAWE